MIYVEKLSQFLPNGADRFWYDLWPSDLTSKSLEELHAMALKIGLNKRFYFHNHSGFPHYPLTLERRQLAVKYGAIEKDIAEWISERKIYFENLKPEDKYKE